MDLIHIYIFFFAEIRIHVHIYRVGVQPSYPIPTSLRWRAIERVITRRKGVRLSENEGRGRRKSDGSLRTEELWREQECF